MCVFLRTKFQVPSTILTSFRQGGTFTSPTSKRIPTKPTQIKVNLGNKFTLGNSLLVAVNMILDLIHVDFFHCQITVGLVEM